MTRESRSGEGDESGAQARTGRSPLREAPGEAFAVPWSISDGFLLIVWSMIAEILVAIPVAAAGVELTGGGPPVFLAIIVAQLVTLGGGLMWLAGKDALGPQVLGPQPPAWRHAGIGLAAGVSGWLLAAIVQTIIRAAFDIGGTPSQPFLQESVETLPTFALGVVSFLVLAPVVEEFIYRGVLFQAFRVRSGLIVALAVTGIVFGAVHYGVLVTERGFNAGGIPALPALAALGAWFAFVLHRSGSLVAAITAHATFNAISVVLTAVFR